MQKKIRFSFSLVKEELEEHLDSINENTNEIQYTTEQLFELTRKVDKLMQRMDEMELMLRGPQEEMPAADYEVPLFHELSSQEREVFLELYHGAAKTYRELAMRLALTEETIRKVLLDLITKGLPLVKRYVKKSIVIELDPQFKRCQQRDNLMALDQELLAHSTN